MKIEYSILDIAKTTKERDYDDPIPRSGFGDGQGRQLLPGRSPLPVRLNSLPHRRHCRNEDSSNMRLPNWSYDESATFTQIESTCLVDASLRAILWLERPPYLSNTSQIFHLSPRLSSRRHRRSTVHCTNLTTERTNATFQFSFFV